MSGIPILLEARGLRVLVVGGGPVAARKAAQFSSAGADVRVVATATSSEMESTGLAVTIHAYEPADIGEAELVIAATNDRVVNMAIAADARALSRLVNIVDAAGGGSFSVMSAHQSGSLTIGVSAGGVPAAARRIRDAVADRFGPPYGSAVAQLGAVRAQLLASGNAAQWRVISDELLDEHFCEAVDEGRFAERLSAWP
ncbi:MAG: siroheme synthase [Gemmatimonadetes bacterium]|nr:siroheme synthase [Gemmatimonadota bacterium]